MKSVQDHRLDATFAASSRNTTSACRADRNRSMMIEELEAALAATE